MPRHPPDQNYPMTLNASMQLLYTLSITPVPNPTPTPASTHSSPVTALRTLPANSGYVCWSYAVLRYRHPAIRAGTAKSTPQSKRTPTLSHSTPLRTPLMSHLFPIRRRLQRQSAVLDRTAEPPYHDVGGRAAPEERSQTATPPVYYLSLIHI